MLRLHAAEIRIGHLGVEAVYDEQRLMQILLLMRVLLLHGGEHVIGRAELLELEVDGGPARQPYKLHVVADLGLREHDQMRDVHGTRDGHKILEAVLASDLEGRGGERLHHASHITDQFLGVEVHWTAADHHRMRRQLQVVTLIVNAKFTSGTFYGFSLF